MARVFGRADDVGWNGIFGRVHRDQFDKIGIYLERRFRMSSLEWNVKARREVLVGASLSLSHSLYSLLLIVSGSPTTRAHRPARGFGYIGDGCSFLLRLLSSRPTTRECR